jgi:hypothetical protein
MTNPAWRGTPGGGKAAIPPDLFPRDLPPARNAAVVSVVRPFHGHVDCSRVLRRSARNFGAPPGSRTLSGIILPILLDIRPRKYIIQRYGKNYCNRNPISLRTLWP